MENEKAIRWWFFIFYWNDYDIIKQWIKNWLWVDYDIHLEYWIIKWKNFIINKQ